MQFNSFRTKQPKTDAPQPWKISGQDRRKLLENFGPGSPQALRPRRAQGGARDGGQPVRATVGAALPAGRAHVLPRAVRGRARARRGDPRGGRLCRDFTGKQPVGFLLVPVKAKLVM